MDDGTVLDGRERGDVLLEDLGVVGGGDDGHGRALSLGVL